MANIEVRIGNTTISNTTPPNKSGNALCEYFAIAGSNTPITAYCTLVGRYVSVQRIGSLASDPNPYLGLCEVQVSVTRVTRVIRVA